MIWADYVILAVIGVSSVLSLLRGFVREALSLLGWILAFWVSLTFTPMVAGLLESQVAAPSLRQAMAFAALFVSTLVASGLVVWLVGALMDKAGLSGTDRVLGMVFGAARGILVVALLVLLAGLTALPRDAWWQQSVLLGHFEAAALKMRSLLPPDIAQHFEY
ncbi:MAG: CvpA family protein [Ectothiorhodospiraceae bacterium]|nr:CvpA family protein [Chromatiales bacterium]MCP5156842.1 CvpA family protein [Ectothiorhodospiraceae bacterium]